MSNVPDIIRDLPQLPPVPDAPPAATWSRIGWGLMIGGVGGFLLWANIFQLAGGAYAAGQVRLSDEKQVVAHVEGGIIRRLAVREGDKVQAGQELVVLDDYNSDTNLAILEKRRWELMARQARLEAVRDGTEGIIYSDDLLRQQDNPAVKDIIAAQERQFSADRTDIEGRRNILQQQIAQYDAIITSLKTQTESGNTQLALIAQEAAGVKELLDKGLERRPRYLALKRQQSALEAQQADYSGRIASYNEKIGETRLQISSLTSDQRAKAVSELTTVQAELNQTNEQWINAGTRSRELTLRAAQSGTVLNLRYRSEGAVVPRSEPIMDIVPDSKVYVVEARVSPNDIDVVHEGLKAQIRLSGLKQRTHLTLMGNVLRVSPDALIDERTGGSFFEARVMFDTTDPEFTKVENANELYPGMPADVIVIAHERTMLQYLTQPIMDSFARAFHED